MKDTIIPSQKITSTNFGGSNSGNFDLTCLRNTCMIFLLKMGLTPSPSIRLSENVTIPGTSDSMGH